MHLSLITTYNFCSDFKFYTKPKGCISKPETGSFFCELTRHGIVLNVINLTHFTSLRKVAGFGVFFNVKNLLIFCLILC